MSTRYRENQGGVLHAQCGRRRGHSITEKVVRGLCLKDTESGRTRAEEIQDQRQSVLNIPLMGGKECQGLLPGSLEMWRSHRCSWKLGRGQCRGFSHPSGEIRQCLEFATGSWKFGSTE